jgi:hypothetical protein
VLFCNNKNIEKISGQSNKNARIEDSCYDVFSYEPVDSKFRPLRINNMLKEVVSNDKPTKAEEKWK